MKFDKDIKDRTVRVVTPESDLKEMKEGDYLRQGVVLDDDDDDDAKKTGCLPHRSRSPSDSSDRRRHASEPTHQSKIAKKLLRFFRSTSSNPGSGRQSPAPPRSVSQPPRRRFMRVVKDENAPPPECIGDNPNIICRYSQEYLTKHYAEVERSRDGGGSRPTMLPYTTSGHTILKKSSTDPTSDRSTAASTATMKHTTFCDVVTVVDSDVGEVREERLHEADDDDVDGAAEERSPSQAGFFLSPTDTDSAPADEVDSGSAPESCSADQKDEMFVKASTNSVTFSSVGLMSIFSTAASPKTNSSEQNPDELKKTSASLPTTKHVKLVDLMAQIRGDDGGERS